MGIVKSALKSVLLPFRKRGARFFRDPANTIIWKAAEISVPELIEGDYLEFGVFQGAALIQAFNAFKEVHHAWALESVHAPQHRARAREIWSNMRFFAFDSFRGLPQPSGFDRRSVDFAEGQYSCGTEGFFDNLKRGKVDLRKVVAVPGWFEDTCTEETMRRYNIRAASIVYIDCDLYESARVVLEFIEPLLVDGTVLIFDDWYCFRGNPDLGEQRAFAEWSQAKPDWTFTQFQKDGATRNSFIVNRRAVL